MAVRSSKISQAPEVCNYFYTALAPMYLKPIKDEDRRRALCTVEHMPTAGNEPYEGKLSQNNFSFFFWWFNMDIVGKV